MKKFILALCVSVLFALFGFSQARQSPPKAMDPGRTLSMDELARMLVGKWYGVHGNSKVTIWFYGKDRLLVSYEADEYKAGKYKISKGKEYFVFELSFGDDVSKVIFDIIDEKHIVIDYNNSVDPDAAYIDTCLLLEKE